MVFEDRGCVHLEELYNDYDDSDEDDDYAPDDDQSDDRSDLEYITDDEIGEHHVQHNPQDALNIAGVHQENENIYKNADVQSADDVDNNKAPGANNNDNYDPGDDNCYESDVSM